MLPPSIGNGRKRVSLSIFQLSDRREIKKHLNIYADTQINTFKPLSL
jgi:hypothetical protein